MLLSFEVVEGKREVVLASSAKTTTMMKQRLLTNIPLLRAVDAFLLSRIHLFNMRYHPFDEMTISMTISMVNITTC